jgi:hypothetical protein
VRERQTKRVGLVHHETSRHERVHPVDVLADEGSHRLGVRNAAGERDRVARRGAQRGVEVESKEGELRRRREVSDARVREEREGNLRVEECHG